MHFLWDMPIRRKLTLHSMMTTTVSLTMACIAFIGYELSVSKKDLIRDLSTLAEIIGANSTAALSFSDPKSAQDTLASLMDRTQIEAACIFAGDGNIFATYVRRHNAEAVPWPRLEANSYRFEHDHLHLFRQIALRGERIGTVYLRSDMEQVHTRFLQYAEIVAGVLVASLVLAFLLSSTMQRAISVPILKLTQTAKDVSEKKDYSVRAVKLCKDEVGTLIDSFNEMLSQIQARDKALGDSEKHFRSLIENASDIITVLDRDHRIRYQSPSVERVLGFRPEELIGQSALDLVNAENIPAVFQELMRITATPDATASLVFRIRRKDGTWVTLESVGTNLLHETSVNGIVVNSRDITERKKAEEQLRTYASKLENSNRELQDFTHVASHDLQEPLRKIQAFGDRLITKYRELLGEQGANYLDRMKDAASRMQTLITDLLSFSRVTTMAQPFVPTDLDKVTRDVLSDLEVRIERTNGRVEVEGLTTIDADPLQMRQLIQNLVGNALKFNRPEIAPFVTVRGRILNEEHADTNRDSFSSRMFELSVADNGIGFDEKYADRIFVIFQRLHGRGQYEGTGVGLAICKKIVERHGGSITAKSTLGQGATFVATLPMNQKNGEES